jgi:hypothetical protein
MFSTARRIGIGVIGLVALITRTDEKVVSSKTQTIIPEIDPLIEAIIYVESRGDTLAYNTLEDAAGCLQIRPIMVREVNRLLKVDSYKLVDRWSRAKSIEMFNVIRSHTKNPTNEKLARNWNGGWNGHKKQSTQGYWKKVKNKFGSLK